MTIADGERPLVSDAALGVAGEVRAWMARRKLSGRELARQLGWTHPVLMRRLNGEKAFDVAELYLIADVLEVPVTAFFDTPVQLGVSIISERTMPSKSASGHSFGRVDLACVA